MSWSYEKELGAKLSHLLHPNIDRWTQGLALQVYHKGRIKADVRLGETYPFYDLASLTKVIFSASVFLHLYSQNKNFLHKDVGELVPWWRLKGLQVVQLMNHTAGLPWWQPFYRKLKGPKNHLRRWNELKDLLVKVQRQKRQQSLYSDVDLLVLGCVMEELMEADLLTIWQKVHGELDLGKIHFNVNNRRSYHRSYYAPTEECRWRQKLLVGEVHDENAWALGGVAPHAGLFGSLEDLMRWALIVRKSYVQEKSNSLWKASALKYFARRSLPKAKGDWGLIFMKPTLGKASCGQCFSGSSFGHTGFTGTSIWFDPRRDLLVGLLSNRVYPTRRNKRFVALRPQIHDLIVECL